MRDYVYRCKDYSLLTPIFKKVLVNPVVKFIPWGLPANIITIISNGFFYIALYLSFNKSSFGNSVFVFIPVLLLAYLIGDHLDGAQAKRTKTGSALGEFCDHYLDAFNNGILMLILFNLFGVMNTWLILIVMVTSYWAHVVVFYEQFKTGWLIFEKLGSLEGVLIAILIILSAYIPSIFDLYLSPMLFGFTLIELVLIAISLGAVSTFIKTLVRTPNIRYSIWMYVVLVSLIGFLSKDVFSDWALVVVITLYSSLYLGKIMIGHLIDGIERSPGLFTALFLMIIVGIPNLYEGNSFMVLFVYLSANIILLIYQTFKALGKYWVWTNPILEDEKS